MISASPNLNPFSAGILVELLLTGGADIYIIKKTRMNLSEKLGRLLADYASNPIKLYSARVTSLVPLLMFMATRMITRYEI